MLNFLADPKIKISAPEEIQTQVFEVMWVMLW